MRAPATKSAKPPVSRPLRVQTSYVFAPLAWGVLVILHRLGANSGRQRMMCTLFRCSGTLPELRSLSFISLGMDVYLLAD